jgi:polyhydroxyalkanoate synthase subunit PhaC
MAEKAPKRGSTIKTDDVSRHFLATLARWTGGMSPQAFGGAWLNVLARLATAPGRQAEIANAALRKTLALAQFSGAALKGEPPRAAGTPYANRFSRIPRGRSSRSTCWRNRSCPSRTGRARP